MITYNSKIITYIAVIIMCYSLYSMVKSGVFRKMFFDPSHVSLDNGDYDSYVVELDIANKKYSEYSLGEKVIYHLFRNTIDSKLRSYRNKTIR